MLSLISQDFLIESGVSSRALTGTSVGGQVNLIVRFAGIVIFWGLPQLVFGATTRDYSTPKNAAKEFFDSINAGDRSRAREATFNVSGSTLDALTALVNVGSEVSKLSEMVENKFGKEAAAQLPHFGRQIGNDAAVEKIDGDIAVLTASNGSSELRLKKVGPDWKVDLASMGELKLPTAAIDELNNTAAAMKRVSDEVVDGTCKSAEDVQEALAKELRTADPTTAPDK